MKKNLVLLLVIFSPILLLAQEFQFVFFGTIHIENSNDILYQISFNILANNQIVGESISDYSGENSTVSIIEGHLDEKNNVLSFTELTNQSTSSSASESEFCFISAENLSIHSSRKNGVIAGEFKGKFPDGTTCVNGNLYLVSQDYFSAQFKRGTSRDSIVGANALLHLFNDKFTLTNGMEMKLEWSSNSGEILVWDNNVIDQDIINIYINNTLVHSNIELTTEKQALNFSFDGGYCEIVIEAVSEGSLALNTLHAILLDGNQVFPVLTSLKKGESVTIKLYR